MVDVDTFLTTLYVMLAQRNYRVVRTQVTGSSRGFALLGLLTLKAPDAIEAFANYTRRETWRKGTLAPSSM